MADALWNPDRILTMKDLEPYFGDDWLDLIVDDIPDSHADPLTQTTLVPLSESQKSPTQPLRHPWFKEGLIKRLPARSTPKDLQNALQNAMKDIANKKALESTILSFLGGSLLTHSRWNWKSFDTKSFTRNSAPIARAAIQEWIVIKQFRRPLLQKYPALHALRRSLTAMLQPFMRSHILVNQSGPPQPIQWTWPDQIVDDESDEEFSVEAIRELTTDAKLTAAFNRDQQAISKLVAFIERSDLA